MENTPVSVSNTERKMCPNAPLKRSLYKNLDNKSDTNYWRMRQIEYTKDINEANQQHVDSNEITRKEQVALSRQQTKATDDFLLSLIQ